MKILSFNKSSSKPEIVHLTILLLSVALQICNTTSLTITEGDSEQLDFQYPCNISRVTFQYGTRAPSYNSANPSTVSLPSNQNLTIKDRSESNECFLYLIIDPVLRNDAGTYFLTGYNGNGDYVYDKSVSLRVDYPPGRASCDSSDSYIEGWMSLQCSARTGNLAGQIICYQNGARLPPLTQPEENGEILNQIIWARLEGLVYCCSSTLKQTKDMCECKDTGWDPVLNTAIINVTDPCPVVLSSTQVPTISQSPTESETTKTSIQATTKTITQTINENKNSFAPLEIVGIVSLYFNLAGLILIAVLLVNMVKVKRLTDLVKRPNVHESVELGQNGTV